MKYFALIILMICTLATSAQQMHPVKPEPIYIAYSPYDSVKPPAFEIDQDLLKQKQENTRSLSKMKELTRIGRLHIFFDRIIFFIIPSRKHK